MDRANALGEWIRKTRLSKGIRSAAELGRRAGLGASHIAMFERGAVRPRWTALEKVANALELAPNERDELYRTWSHAGTPDAVRAATAGPAIPGLTIWKHLPELLHAIPHSDFETAFACPDYVVGDVVPAAGALLAWVALAKSEPRGKRLRALQGQVDGLMQALKAYPEGAHRWSLSAEEWTMFRLARDLPDLWRGHLFGDREAAVRALRPVSRWDYEGGHTTDPREPNLSFTFANHDLQGAWGVERIETPDVVALHDALLTVRLWRLVGLPPGDEQLKLRLACTLRFSTAFVHLLSRDISGIREHLLSHSRPPFEHDLRRAIRRARFFARAADDPLIAGASGLPPGCTRDALLRHCDDVAALLRELHDRLIERPPGP